MAVMTAVERLYRAAKGARFSDADAAIIGPFLEQLAAEQGSDVHGLTTDMIVDAARPEDSPIHHFFEWDATAAHEQYLLVQARHLANCWRVEIVEHVRDEPRIWTLPGMVSIRLSETPEQREYIPIHDALENPAFLAQIADDAQRRLRYWQSRFAQYRSLPQFAKLGPIFEALDSLGEDSE